MTEIERLRAELWARVYAGIAAALNGKQVDATRWADQAVKEFNERFVKVEAKS